VKQISVGVDRDGRISYGPGGPNGFDQIRMQGRLAAQKNDVCRFAPMRERFKPHTNDRQGEIIPAMLRRVDVTVPAGKVTAGQNMKKNINGLF
jgi:hypothetical protein